ncbi:MAG TPA: SPOR domain-containing protein [Accumulibacter sp.]|uniref:SPOR domain-containing protein n=1 Tax=Accumulibacter sp. TaxID=2053492 RepID=UPI00287AD733|nr:SPOR domain-containing protein [Accumulibacter sp.]MDS4056329.1 SPOR domain-containing protein [Accumulibacter sp.]HMV05730.1 SPOR domain-containing protein [Accumulibacter sp.]HMX67879.1 SPOR domain-containing protein [Accumulibacter sp.]HNJ50591.1 SPOR domain-containing protein [Accumulibacter sp.]
MTETSDPQLQLKKRARRRLVGAVAFAGLAAVVLPMVMDEEPKPLVQNVQIRIPGQDQLPFKPGAAAPGSPAKATGVEQPAVSAVPGDAVDAAGAKAGAVSSSSGRRGDAENSAPTPKAADKTPETRKATSPVLPSASKQTVRPAQKPADKTTAQKAAKPAAKPAADDKRSSQEQQRAKAILSGKTGEAKASKPRTQHFIQLGAFTEAEKAKQLQGKVGGAGVDTYTESYNAPDGSRTRVRAGPFPNREAADKALEKLKQLGVSGAVVGKQ